MGAGRFDVATYNVQASEAKVSSNSGFTAESMRDEFNPLKVTKRFSKRGPFNVFMDPITVLVGLDVTGSMGRIPKSLLLGDLGRLMVDLKKTFNRPNENLQISFAGVGDAKTDHAPLQVTHFESDNRFAQQLQKIWLEGGGGGNGGESYNILWWYAANKTSLSYVEQDRRKGILITIGDDYVHPDLTASEIRSWLDPDYDGKDLSNRMLLNAVQRQYEVYHIVVTDGSAYTPNVSEEWRNLLGSNNVYTCLSDGVAKEIENIVTQHRPIQRAEMDNLMDQEQWLKHSKENLTDEQWAEVLGYTLCPLTREFMIQPVCWGGNKKAYEQVAVEEYVREKAMDPISRTKLTSKLDLIFNPNIAQLCEDYKSFFNDLPELKRKHLVDLTLGPVAQTLFFEKESDKAMADSKDKYRELECPIGLDGPMVDPVTLEESHITYDRKNIERWLETHNTDPMTGQELKSKKLFPNYAMKGVCDKALAEMFEKLSM